MPGSEPITARARDGAERLIRESEHDVDTLVADGRYQWINGVVRQVVTRPSIERITRTDRIDAVVTHRYLGIPIFFVLMWAVFKLTTDISAPYLDWVASVVDGPVTRWVVELVSLVGLSGTWFESLLVDGVVAGVGGVLVFVPVLMSLYVALALLEDSGYMARAAFVMDRLMRGFGLHGKSFLPMLVGFGCTVPAIYATRTLRDERDRLLTGLLVPFMSCGARLPVYVLFAAVFFPEYGGTVVFAMYLIGVVTALLLAVVLKRSLFKTAHPTPFVMELPPYRLPTPRGVMTQMWSRTKSFVRKAWTIILFMSVVIWFLMAVPADPGAGPGPATEASVEDSLFATAAGAIAPVFAPLGFDSWQASGAIITGLIAKEVVVSTMAQVYGAELPVDEDMSTQPSLLEDLGFIVVGFIEATIDTLKSIPLVVGIDLSEDEAEEEPSALMQAIQADFERSSGGYAALAGLAFMVFVLLYTPCMVAIAAARHEFGARWMWVSVVGQFAVAWLVAFAVFQGGRFLVG
jgi:ferrous iron transport protein B